jgi:prepilin-type N-terminal cleavage/methylation domain-containing protein
MEELQVKSLFNKLVKRNGGFTLTELAVAMVVVGILASIAVPSFLGARNNAFDREAQAAVDAALNAASLHYANNGDFTNSLTATCNTTGSEQLALDLERLDPNYDFMPAASISGGPRQISVTTSLTFNTAEEALGCQAFHAVALSRSGTCWVGRLTVEGKFLSTDTGAVNNTAVIAVNTGTFNTSNSVTTGFTDLAVNGKAYGGIIPVASGAGASPVTPSDTLANSVLDCTAAAQKPASAPTPVTAGVDTNKYYESWRTVVFAKND